MDSLADQDISPSKRKLINQAIYEWNIRVNNNYILIMDFAMSAGEYEGAVVPVLNGANIFTESVINTVLGGIDKAFCGGLPVTSTLLSPELPRYKEGDAMLKMIVLYKYNSFATKYDTLDFGSFGQRWPLINRLTGSAP